MFSNRPRICFVQPHTYPILANRDDVPFIGGAELQVATVARLLAARGWSVSMICLNYEQEDDIQIDGVRVLRAYRPHEGVPVVRFFWPRLTSVWRCMKRANADIYYQKTAGMLTGVVAAFCKLNDRKSVFAASSNPDLVPRTPRIKYARDRQIYSYGLRTVDRIFVQNNEQAVLCKQLVGKDAVIVPNCYAVSHEASMPDALSYVLWVSTIRRLKRPELFLRLAESFPNVEFRMIGGAADDERALFSEIRERAESIKNLRFMGFRPFSETERQFDGARLFVNTSESEGVPNAFLQAWARAVPSVSFVDAGARLDGERIGYTVQSFDEMKGVVKNLLECDAARRNAGRRCNEYVRRQHSPDAVIAAYEREFCSLANCG